MTQEDIAVDLIKAECIKILNSAFDYCGVIKTDNFMIINSGHKQTIEIKISIKSEG